MANYVYCDYKKINAKIFINLWLVFLIIFASIKSLDVSRDSYGYTWMFDQIYSYNQIFYSRNHDLDLMTILIPCTLRQINAYSYFLLFLIFAIIGVFCKIKAIEKYSPLPLLSLLIYFSHFYLLHEMTQIRQGVATGILLLSVKDIYDRKLWKFIIKLALASAFHEASLIFVFAYFINVKKINRALYLLILLGLVILSMHNTLSLGNFLLTLSKINTKIVKYVEFQNAGYGAQVKVFGVFSILYTTLTVFLIIFYKNICEKEKYGVIFIKLLYISQIIYYMFAAQPVFSWRGSDIFAPSSIICLTYIIYFVKPVNLGKVLLILLALLLLTFDIFSQQLINAYSIGNF